MERLKNVLVILLVIGLVSLLAGCTSYARILNFPFDQAGRGLNSPTSELTPHLGAHYLVFISDRRGSQDVYLYDIDTRSLIDLPGLNSLDAIASEPVVSEDGNTIVFTATREGRSGIYIYNRETQQLRDFTANIPAQVRHPTIGADGETIAFESSQKGQWDIVVYNSSGQSIDFGRGRVDP